ncbi:hypothetical protein [Taklimakanibacter lacteus]|uniref:hypothetical protein n=1 Tax=Taklimakanibacter lacteus TaxID=2268456 RepID=UPI0013C4E731
MDTHSREADNKLPEWCLSHFPGVDEDAWAISRPLGKFAPFKLEDMIAPADLVTKTEIVGKLPGYIRKYRGVWIWPTISQPPDFAIFVERLSPKEMMIAFLGRATAENESYREKLRANSRQKLTWNGTAFSSAPEGDLQSKTTIYISAFGHAMLVAHENKSEGSPPLCFISSKHY